MHKEDKDEIKIRQEQKRKNKKRSSVHFKNPEYDKIFFSLIHCNNVTEDKIKLIKLDNPYSICVHLFKKEIEEIKCPPF